MGCMSSIERSSNFVMVARSPGDPGENPRHKPDGVFTLIPSMNDLPFYRLMPLIQLCLKPAGMGINKGAGHYLCNTVHAEPCGGRRRVLEVRLRQNRRSREVFGALSWFGAQRSFKRAAGNQVHSLWVRLTKASRCEKLLQDRGGKPEGASKADSRETLAESFTTLHSCLEVLDMWRRL